MANRRNNPINISEGGSDMVSKWGTAFSRGRFSPVNTVLPHHEPHQFAGVMSGQWGVPFAVRTSLPRTEDMHPGPLSLRQQMNGGKK